MNNPTSGWGVGRRVLLQAGAAAGAGALAGRLALAATPAQPDAAAVANLIKDWPRDAKAAAEAMLRKYGMPQEATATQIRWQDNRPWTRTVVHKGGVEPTCWSQRDDERNHSQPGDQDAVQQAADRCGADAGESGGGRAGAGAKENGDDDGRQRHDRTH